MRFRHKLLALPVAASLIVLTACGSTGASDPGATSDAPIATGDASIETLRVAAAFDSIYGQFNPFLSSEKAASEGNTLTALYGSLVRFDADGELEGSIAESLTASDDSTVWTLKLREGLEFSDGEPLDAEAVKWNLDFNSDPANGTFHAGGVVGTTTEATDDVTVEITPGTVNANFDKLMTTALGFMVSPTAYEADPEGFGQKPVGAGPYVIESWTKDVELVLAANPTYYDADNTSVKRVVIQVLRDPAQMLNLLAAGDVDFLHHATTQLKQAEAAGFGITEVTLSGMTDFLFNVRKAPFDDQRARQAVAYALDLDAIGQVARGRDAGADWFAPASPFFRGDVRPATNDPEKAQALFDELAAEGKPVSFRLLGVEGSQLQFEAVQSQLAAFENVDVQLDLKNVQTYVETLNKTHDFEMGTHGVSFVDPEPRFYNLLVTDGYENKGGFSNPEIDALFKEARLAPNTAERKALYDQIQDIVQVEIPYIKITDPTQPYVHEADLVVTTVNDGIVLYEKIVRK